MGTFTAQTELTLADQPYAVAVGDFNSAGNLDLAVASAKENSVTVWLNNGGWVFQKGPDHGGALTAGAANAFNPTSTHSVMAGGTLNLDGYEQTVSALSNAGTVALNGPPGATLTVTGNYTGAGGLIQFNTVLNDDASARTGSLCKATPQAAQTSR